VSNLIDRLQLIKPVLLDHPQVGAELLLPRVVSSRVPRPSVP
jgi:hypothetical protein